MPARTWICASLLIFVVSVPGSAHAEEPADRLSESIAQAKVLWDNSCVEQDAIEGCVVLRLPPPTHQCRGARPLLRPGARRGATAARAQRSLEHSIGRVEALQLAKQDREALAEAHYLIAETALATFLAIELPTGLSFSAETPSLRKRSEARFKEFLKEADEAAAQASEAYASIINRNPAADIKLAATAQTARIQIHYAQLIDSIEIPLDVRTGPFAADSIDAFCDEMHKKTKPIAERGRKAAQSCLAMSQDSTSPWNRICKDLARPPTR